MGVNRLTELPFVISELEILNVGAIDLLALDFESSDYLDAIYGSNGIGKTTILECMSLLGHLPCFPTIELPLGATPNPVRWYPSLLRQITDTESGNQDSERLDLVRDTAGGQLSDPRRLIDSFASRAHAGIGLVYFKVKNGSDVVQFCIMAKGSSVRTTITGHLSREHGGTTLSDFALENYFACIPLLPDARDASFRELTHGIARGRSFFIEGECGSLGHRSLDELDPEATVVRGNGPALRVAYINTDLNDFGRGNDLRESPKDLRRSLDEQLLERFRIPISASGYAYVDEMNGSLQRILQHRHVNYSDAHAQGDGMTITRFALGNDGTLDLRIRRGSTADPPVRADFLSAGENEVFFILLMMRMVQSLDDPGMGRRRGILLLDEPDLHLATASKVAFYREIMQQCAETQVVIASHSHSPVEAIRALRRRPRCHVRVLYRARISLHQTQLRDTYDIRYLAGIRRTNIGGSPASALKGQFLKLKDWVEGKLSPHFGGERWRRRVIHSAAVTAAITCFGVMLVGVVAVLNDASDVISSRFGKDAYWGVDQVRGVHRAVTLAGMIGLLLSTLLTLHFVYLSLCSRYAARRVGRPEMAFGARSPASPKVIAIFLAFAVSMIAGWLLLVLTN